MPTSAAFIADTSLIKQDMFSTIFLYSPMSYFGIFIWFLFLDQLTPIPEEVTLLSIGYIAKNHLINPYYAGLSAFLGLTIIDNLF